MTFQTIRRLIFLCMASGAAAFAAAEADMQPQPRPAVLRESPAAAAEAYPAKKKKDTKNTAEQPQPEGQLPETAAAPESEPLAVPEAAAGQPQTEEPIPETVAAQEEAPLTIIEESAHHDAEDEAAAPEPATSPVEAALADTLPERKPLELDGVDNPMTVKYRERYLSERDRKWIIEALKRSVPYRPYIRQQLQAKQLPMILQYLPIVESYYNVNAVSSTKATGIWQFMENSMAPYLSKDSWYDDRRDPWKSTDAALAKLAWNYQQFGDWEIAIAAYNCGAGAMGKVVKNNKGKDFWYLAENNLLKTQSAQYVPKLLAMADIIENAAYYNVPDIAEADALIDGVEPEEFDYITTAGMFSLKQIAETGGIDESLISLLNPALLRKCTPARQSYQLRLPKGTAEEVGEKLKSAGTAADALIYTVKEGDTLWGISRRYGLTVADLCEINNIKEKSILRIKQKIIVPIFP